MSQPTGFSSEPRQAAPRMGAILDQSPALKQLIRQRMREFPEYGAFLQSYGTAVVDALNEDQPRDQRSVA